MKKLPIAPIKRQSENTISLINIVFLMLIFFLIAGQLAPPMDRNVDPVSSEDAEPLPPPDALVAHQDGSLHFRGIATTVTDFLASARSASPADPGSEPIQAVQLVADKNLPATKLLELVSELQAAGAGKVTVVTVRAE